MKRSPTTVTSYSYRAQKIIHKILKEKKIRSLEKLDLRSLPLWLANKRKELLPRSFRQYKAALTYYLEKVGNEEAFQAIEMLYEMRSTGCKKDKSLTSANKMKRFRNEDIKRYDAWLAANNHMRWSSLARSWLAAGLITGLRPIEWVDAEILDVDGEKALRVINAKQSHGRAHGYDRILLLGSLSIPEFAAIERHIELVRRSAEIAGGYASLFKKLSDFVHLSTRKCWTRRAQYPTLYSLRHQFAANLKRAGVSRAEIAALMGHGSDETAGFHYGKKLAGEQIDSRIIALPANVERVRVKAKQHPGKTQVKKKAKPKHKPESEK